MIIDIESFVFTTEGHLLPLSLARLSPETVVPVSKWSISKALTLSTCHEHSALLVNFFIVDIIVSMCTPKIQSFFSEIAGLAKLFSVQTLFSLILIGFRPILTAIYHGRFEN